MLSEAAGFNVHHENADRRHPAIAHPYSPFPIDRFLGPQSHGECHGFLRYHLSPYVMGNERLFPRAVIFRDLRKVITSWMNHDDRHESELASVAYEVCSQWMNLEWYHHSDPACRVFDFDRLVTDVAYLESFFDHFRLPAIATREMTAEVLNPTLPEDRRFEWGVDAEDIFRRVNSRLWLPRGIQSNYVKY
jgi:hypothetical protein